MMVSGLWFFFVFLPTFQITSYGMDPAWATAANLSHLLALVSAVPAFGIFFDWFSLHMMPGARWHRQSITLQATAAVLVALSIGIFQVMARSGTIVALGIQLFLVVGMVAAAALLPCWIMALFPAETRYTGSAFCVNLGSALAGALAPSSGPSSGSARCAPARASTPRSGGWPAEPLACRGAWLRAGFRAQAER
ncbi:unnamed protein product [Prorocentrum cordatum]|uniref:Solute carrier family 40 protein n=1 Tax=Prorocentrum cordatum TaxID=2364126 RepID=A0ABN9S7I3_9DINO|nr:unnamed protein product [Polarella glacialis]